MYSTGRFEGDTLVVTTTGFVAATLEPRYGVMHSENLKLTERLAVNAATRELEITCDHRRGRGEDPRPAASTVDPNPADTDDDTWYTIP